MIVTAVNGMRGPAAVCVPRLAQQLLGHEVQRDRFHLWFVSVMVFGSPIQLVSKRIPPAAKAITLITSSPT